MWNSDSYTPNFPSILDAKGPSMWGCFWKKRDYKKIFPTPPPQVLNLN